MQVLLSVRLTKGGKPIARPRSVRVELELDSNGRAMALDPRGGPALQMVRSRVDLVSADGLLITGFEERSDHARYQEWWCRPVTGETGR